MGLEEQSGSEKSSSPVSIYSTIAPHALIHSTPTLHNLNSAVKQHAWKKLLEQRQIVIPSLYKRVSNIIPGIKCYNKNYYTFQ